MMIMFASVSTGLGRFMVYIMTLKNDVYWNMAAEPVANKVTSRGIIGFVRDLKGDDFYRTLYIDLGYMVSEDAFLKESERLNIRECADLNQDVDDCFDPIYESAPAVEDGDPVLRSKPAPQSARKVCSDHNALVRAMMHKIATQKMFFERYSGRLDKEYGRLMNMLLYDKNGAEIKMEPVQRHGGVAMSAVKDARQNFVYRLFQRADDDDVDAAMGGDEKIILTGEKWAAVRKSFTG